MSISVSGNRSGVDLLMTFEGEMPLDEYRNSSLNGVGLGEVQLLGSIVYNATVRSRAARLYLAFLTGIYLWMFGEALLCVWGNISQQHTKLKKVNKGA